MTFADPAEPSTDDQPTAVNASAADSVAADWAPPVPSASADPSAPADPSGIAGNEPDERGATSPVAGVLAALSAASNLPLAEQPDAFQQIHESLQGSLADLDDA